MLFSIVMAACLTVGVLCTVNMAQVESCMYQNNETHNNQLKLPPLSGFFPSLIVGRAAAPSNHGAAAPQRHAQAVRCWTCVSCRQFARLGGRNERGLKNRAKRGDAVSPVRSLN